MKSFYKKKDFRELKIRLKNFKSILLYDFCYNSFKYVKFIVIFILYVLFTIGFWEKKFEILAISFIIAIFTYSLDSWSFFNTLFKFYKSEINEIIENKPDLNKIIPENSNYVVESHDYKIKIDKKEYSDIAYYSYSDKLNSKLRDSFKSRIEIIISSKKEKKIKNYIGNNYSNLSKILYHKYNNAQNKANGFFNESKLSLYENLIIEDSVVYCNKSCYYDSFLTNENAGNIFYDENDSVLFSLKDKFPIDYEDYSLKELSESNEINNHIGISTIALTKDNHIYYWIQSDKNQQSKKLKAPSGSGSFDYSDIVKISKKANLYYSLTKAMDRELIEESLDSKMTNKNRKKYIQNTKILGYFRWIDRGGKPEFVGITKLNVDYIELQANINEVIKKNPNKFKKTLSTDEDNKKINNVPELIEWINRQMTSEYNSLPYYYNLKCIKEYCNSNKEELETLYF